MKHTWVQARHRKHDLKLLVWLGNGHELVHSGIDGVGITEDKTSAFRPSLP